MNEGQENGCAFWEQAAASAGAPASLVTCDLYYHGMAVQAAPQQNGMAHL